jgi:hypothetical protein
MGIMMIELLLAFIDVHGVSDGRQIEVRTAEPLVHEPSPFEVGIFIAVLKK